MLTIEGTSLARENLGKRPDRIRALSRALEHSKRNWRAQNTLVEN